jgi:CSLREA domain-containing protein
MMNKMNCKRNRPVLLCSLLACVMVGTLGIFLPTTTQAASFTVNTLVDEADGSCANGDCSLRDALALASAGDTINFSVSGTLTLSQGELIITKSLNILGPGSEQLTISGNSATRIFNINAGTSAAVTISGLTFANGNSGNWYGGGISNSTISGGSQLRVSNCQFSSNHSEGDGGAIYNSGELTISGCDFSGNSAHSGGAIASSFGSASITGSSFSENTARDDGGAVSATNENTLDVIFSTFKDNEANSEGGAIYSDHDSPLTVDYSYFSGNRALWGGGIDHNGEATIKRSSFYENIAYSTGFNNSEGYGGGLYNKGALTLENTSVFSNTAEAGGGLYVYDGKTTLIRNSTFSANQANFNGDNLSNNRGLTTIQNTIIADGPQNCSSSFNFIGDSSHNLTTDNSCLTYSASFVLVTPAKLGLSWQNSVLTIGDTSLALDAGDNTVCAATDQLGWTRPWDGDGDSSAVCDIGAHEFVPNLRQLFLPLLVR